MLCLIIITSSAHSRLFLYAVVMQQAGADLEKKIRGALEKILLINIHEMSIFCIFAPRLRLKIINSSVIACSCQELHH